VNISQPKLRSEKFHYYYDDNNNNNKYVSNVPGKHEVKELQKTAILGTAHILQEVLV